MPPELSPDDIVALNHLMTVARVLGGTAHEVNNALQVIGGSAELLEGQNSIAESARAPLQRIRSQMARAAAAVKDLVQFAHERAELPSRVALTDVVAKAAGMRAVSIRRAGIVLDVDDADGPAAVVSGRASQLQQVALNLILNAEQALAGKAGGRISLRVTEEAGHGVFRVTDNGAGFAAALDDDVFTTSVTSRSRADAPGLGLAAARIIARAHGGELRLESLPSGVSAALSIPLAR